MKKLFMMLATAGILLVSSCAKEDISANAWGEGEEVLVTFTTAVPGVATRAEATYGNGDSAERLVYCVFDENWTAVGDGQVEIADAFAGNNLETTVTMRLVSGKTYNFIFWADANEGYYTFNDLTNIKVNGAFVGNDESRDAFYATIKGLYVNGTVNKPVELRRPFAQLNMLTADLEVAKKMGYDLTKTEVVAPMYTAFDLVAEEVTGAATEITFAMNDRAENTYEINGIDYEFIAMNYLLVPADETQISCTLKSDNGYKQEFHTVPVERNHRTNLYGNLLTDPANFSIKINPDFENDNHERWDGVTLNQPADLDDSNNYLYSISHAAEMAWVLKNHNVSAAYKTVLSLECDIDFGGKEIGQLVNRTSPYYANYELRGNGNTIRNFVVAGEVSQTRATDYITAGLFPATNGFTASELTIEGAVVGGNTDGSIDCYAGALIGTSDGPLSLTNVVVKNSTITGVNKVGAFIGQCGSNYQIEGCHAENNTITGIGTDAGSVGGLLGYVGLGGNNANLIKLSTVKGGAIIVEQGEDIAKRASGAFIGTIHRSGSSVLTIEDCMTTGVDLSKSNTAAPLHPLFGAIREDSPVKDGEIIIDGVKNDYVSTAAGWNAAMASDAKEIVITLTADVTVPGTTGVYYGGAETQSIIVNGNGHTLTYEDTYRTYVNLTNTEATLTLNNLKFVHSQSHTDPNTHYHNYCVSFNANVVANDVDFNEGIVVGAGFKGVFNKVAFHKTKFTGSALWIAAGGDVTLEDCSFDYVDGVNARAIKIFDENVGGELLPANLAVNNTTFKAYKKAAVLVSSKGGANITWGAGNDISAVLEDSVNAVWVDEDYAQAYSLTTVTGCTKFLEGAVVAEPTDDLADVIEDGAAVILAAGTYQIPDTPAGSSVTLIGAGNPEDTIIAGHDDGASEGDGDYSFDSCNVTFENMTITFTTTYFPGFPRMKGTFKNCIINGVYTLYDDSTFENCTFNISGDLYNVWTWGATVATFNNCTFNCDGKAVLLYGRGTTKLTMNNCKFNDNGDNTVTGKAAIEIGNDYGTSYELVVNKATVNGFSSTSLKQNQGGYDLGSTLWGNKDRMPQSKLNVVVDGVDVY